MVNRLKNNNLNLIEKFFHQNRLPFQENVVILRTQNLKEIKR